MNEIEFIHPYNKESIKLPVILITRTYVSVRWNLSGIYDLNLLKNVLTARSAAARRRNPCLFTAVDIQKVRDAVKVYFDKQDLKERVRLEREKHEASMPAPAPYPYAVRK